MRRVTPGSSDGRHWRTYRPPIEQKADVLRGKPVIKGTRISVELILERHGDGWTDDQLPLSFPHLRPEHIRAAQTYAAASPAVDEFMFLNEPAA